MCLDQRQEFLRLMIEQTECSKKRAYRPCTVVLINKNMKATTTDPPKLTTTTTPAPSPDVGEPTLKGIQLAIDELVKEDPQAKNVTPQQVIDLSFLP